MSKEKPILQMLRDGYSQRHIASFLHVSRNTVARVAKAASEHQLPNDVLESMDEVEIRHTLFPEEALIPTLVTPDFPYIHKELLKNGVTLKLLWQEYVDTCKHLALYDTGVDAEYGDKLITLSTCESSLENGRLVLVAKRIAE